MHLPTNSQAGAPAELPFPDAGQVEQLVAALPTVPDLAVAELTRWLGVACSAPQVEVLGRVQSIRMLDEAAQLHVRKLAMEISLANGDRRPESRLAATLRGYWRQSAIALSSLVELERDGACRLDRELPVIAARALRAAGGLLKLSYAHYHSRNEPIWRMAKLVFGHVEREGMARAAVVPYASIPTETTVEREFVRVAMLGASAPSNLGLPELAVLDHLIARYVDHFDVLATPGRGVSHWLDLDDPHPPRRYIASGKPRSSMRFLSAARAIPQVARLLQRAQSRGLVPADLSLIHPASEAQVHHVLEHAATHWQNVRAGRRRQRHAIKTEIAAIVGFDAALHAIGTPASMVDKLGPGAFWSAQVWVTENVSAAGLGATANTTADLPPSIGALVALKPVGAAEWLLGLVRRLETVAEDEIRIGVETLSRAPVAVELWPLVSGTPSQARKEAILLSSIGPGSASIEMVLRTDVLAEEDALIIRQGSELFALKLDAIVHRTEDFAHVRFACSPYGTATRPEAGVGINEATADARAEWRQRKRL